MQNPSNHPSKPEGLFFYLFLLTCFLVLLEISFFIQCNKAYLGDFTFVSNHISIPWRILPGIAAFIAAQLFLHALYLVALWALVAGSALTLRLSEVARIRYGIMTFGVSLIFILSANQQWFPNSRLVELTSMVLANHTLANLALVGSGLVLGAQALLALVGAIQWLGRLRFALIVSAILAAAAFMAMANQPRKGHPYVGSKPNIILVGVDSLRPDHLGYFGSDTRTPFFDDFMNQASVFTDSITPIARTFPSWTGILTSLYPNHVNVRTNLSDQTKAHLENALPSVLVKAGYHTVFATDETRFSNLSTAYGFQRIVTPPIGLNDFLLGTFNDFPLSNLVVNTKLGQWLFPYSFGNRPAYITYDPNSFLKKLQPTLNEQQTQPLFLAVHFCLPHSPYLWAQLSGYAVTDARQRYSASVSRVDAQVNQLFANLKSAGLLNNAVVVLLSDHGEALELRGDRVTEAAAFMKPHGTTIPRFYPASISKEKLDQSAGHGTDILGLSQYHNVLAVRLYGRGKQAVGDHVGEVSTLDIMPTVLGLAGISTPKLDGKTLAPVVLGKAKSVPSHPIFLESDYSPQAICTVYPETRNVMLEGIHLFAIDPLTTRLTVKPSMVKMIINSKQLGVIQGGWILAFYPQANGSRMPILVNLTTGEWTNDLGSSFAHHSPAASLYHQLKAFYGSEMQTHQG